jgi:hypothetical protein
VSRIRECEVLWAAQTVPGSYELCLGIDVRADIGDVFRSVVHRLGEGNTNPQRESLQAMLEEWPSGRWSVIAAMVLATFGDTCR